MSRSSNGTTLSRQQILDITTQCLHEQGYDKTTIRQIAKMLNCAVGSIYRYFEDKRELLYAVTEQRLEPVVGMLEAGATFEGSVTAYVRRANDDGEAYRMMFWLAAVINRTTQDQAESDFDASPAFTLDAEQDADLQASAGPKGRMSYAFPQQGTPLPAVVERVIDGWATVLGDRGVARACWAMLHGSMMLGLPATQIVEATLAYAEAAAPQGLGVTEIDQAADAIIAAAESDSPTDASAAFGQVAAAEAPVTMPAASVHRKPSQPVVEGDPDFRAISGRPRAAMTRDGEMPVPVEGQDDGATASVPVQTEPPARRDADRGRSSDDVTLL